MRAPGFLVSSLAEENFKILAYYIFHGIIVPRTVPMPEITRVLVRSIVDLRDEEKDHVDPDTKPSVLTGNWSKTQDTIREWLRHYLGANNSPLAYVVRDDLNPKPEADDPSANYETIEEEIIARSPIESALGVYTETCKFYNRAIWDKLADLLRDTKSWVHIQKAPAYP